MSEYCGHLRVYHARGMPEGVYERRTGECLFCEVADLTAERDRLKSALERIRHVTLSPDKVWDIVHETLDLSPIGKA